MIKGMDNMDIDFLRNMRNVTFPLSGYPSPCVRNKKIRIGNRTNTFSGEQLLLLLAFVQSVHYPYFLCHKSLHEKLDLLVLRTLSGNAKSEQDKE